MKIFRIIPPPITATLLVVAAYLFDTFFPAPAMLQSNIFFITFALFGVIIIGWSIVLFRKVGTTLNPNKKPTQMITSGPYKISRNPIYAGLVSILFGVAFLNGEFVFFVLPIIFFILMNRIVIPYEEKLIVDAIGNENFKTLSQKTRRWF